MRTSSRGRQGVAINPVAKTDGVRLPKALPKPAKAEAIAAAFAIGGADFQLALMLGALAGPRTGEIVRLEATDIDFESEPPSLIVGFQPPGARPTCRARPKGARLGFGRGGRCAFEVRIRKPLDPAKVGAHSTVTEGGACSRQPRSRSTSRASFVATNGEACCAG